MHLNSTQAPFFVNPAKAFRYHSIVFLVPPWEEIFEKDDERKHDFQAAKKEFEELIVKYKQFGYETVLIPKIPVKERADFALKTLGISH